jgi:large subunit ribosomal protein L9
MDVILLKEVAQVGKAGAVVHVKPGFARNFLLPRGLALPASAGNVKAFEARQQHAQQKQERLRKQADQAKHKLESRSLTLKLHLGEKDVAFGSITVNDLADALQQEGIVVEKHAIGLDEPIKTLGIYEVPVRIHPEVTATLKLWVVKA